MKKTSWRTSASGIIAGLVILIYSLAGLGGVQVPVIQNGAVVQDENGQVVYEDAKPFNLEGVLMGLGLMGVGAFARDNKVSSQNVGIRR